MPQTPPDDGNYTINDGDWVASVAIQYGYAEWDSDVWQHANNSSLKQKRTNPRILAPNDVLYIPPFTPKYETRPTEACHTFILKVPNDALHIRLLKLDGTPFKNEDYTLDIQYNPGGGTFKQQNTQTDANGMVSETIPSTSISGKLTLKSLNQTVNLQLGRLHPMDPNDKPTLIRATQQRLNWIGFDTGYIDGQDSPKLQTALRSFQQFCKDATTKPAKPDPNAPPPDPRITDAGDVDGTLSTKTQTALIKYYGA